MRDLPEIDMLGQSAFANACPTGSLAISAIAGAVRDVIRRHPRIVGIDSKGAQRDLRIRALRGGSVANSGRWVASHLAEVLGVSESLMDKDLENRDGVLVAVSLQPTWAGRCCAKQKIKKLGARGPGDVDADACLRWLALG